MHFASLKFIQENYKIMILTTAKKALFFIGLIVFALSACTNPKTNEEIIEQKKQMLGIEDEVEEVPQEEKEFDASIPDACTLLTTQEIASVIGVDASVIGVKDGSNKANLKARSCFFRWEHTGIPNSGVLVQAQGNPVPDEFPQWANDFISNKIQVGEKGFTGGAGNEVYMYKPFNSPGIEGAYSYELGKYFWRMDGSDLLYMIAFNIPSEEAEQLAWAEKISAFVVD